MAFIAGESVLVETATGERRSLRVVLVSSGTVYVTTHAEFEAASRQGVEPTVLVGFPAQDVSSDASG